MDVNGEKAITCKSLLEEIYRLKDLFDKRNEEIRKVAINNFKVKQMLLAQREFELKVKQIQNILMILNKRSSQ